MCWGCATFEESFDFDDAMNISAESIFKYYKQLFEAKENDKRNVDKLVN